MLSIKYTPEAFCMLVFLLLMLTSDAPMDIKIVAFCAGFGCVCVGL